MPLCSVSKEYLRPEGSLAVWQVKVVVVVVVVVDDMTGLELGFKWLAPCYCLLPAPHQCLHTVHTHTHTHSHSNGLVDKDKIDSTLGASRAYQQR